MKNRLFVILAAVLLCSVSAIAWASVQGLTGLVTVTFEVDPAEAGSVLKAGAKVTSSTAFSNMDLTVSAEANPGYGFVGWYIGGELKGTDATAFKFNVGESNLTVVAKFKELPASTLTLDVHSDCAGMGSVSVDPAGTVSDRTHKYTSGTTVTVTASAAKGYRFVRWVDGTGTQLSTTTSYKFDINSDQSVYAVFSKLENYRADLIAFPGVDGYGRLTSGGRMMDGRGAHVYYVTRLDDTDEEGSLRWAVTTGDDTPRTVLFKVAGTIYLKSQLTCKPNITIAGQTAPAGGICIAGYKMKLSSNSILRHLRFRAGDLYKDSQSALGVENVENIVLDHCSFSWSMEENLTLYDTDYTTTQWCIFSEGLYNSRNSKGARSYAAQWGGEHGTLHHCLFANCNNRSPRFNGVRASNNDRHVDNEFVNNVVYNWGKPNSIYGGENDQSCNGYNRTYMINNYFRPGPATQKNTSGSRYFVGASSSNGVGQWYLSGNKFELSSKWAPASSIWSNTVLQKVNDNNYYGFISNSSERALNLESVGNSQATFNKYVLPDVVEWSGLQYESADEAYRAVVQQAGASMPRFDEVDARILAEAAGERDPQFAGRTASGVVERGMGIINTPYDITLASHDEFAALYEGDNAADNRELEVTCYPRLQMDRLDAHVVDTDGDGMPDGYEVEVGLNPEDATDGMRLTTSGYSNLELYLNGVADGRIDATKYTRHQAVQMQNLCNAVVGEGGFATVQEAVNAAPADESPYYIFVKAGSYKGHVQIDRQNVHLIGQNRNNTIITDDKTNNDDGGVDKAATINVTADNVSFDNLTIQNTRTDKQAVALYSKGDRIAITNCHLEGWQDTYRTGKDGQRHIVRNTRLTGTTDFIYGAGEVFFDSCTLHVMRTSNVIVAPDHTSAAYGYVFRNATISSDKSSAQTHLGRPWGNTPKVAFINTRLTEGVTVPAEGWQEMGGTPIQMAEYNTTDAAGNAVDLTKRRTSFGGVNSKAVLGMVEKDSYQPYYMLRGSDDWDADWQAFILPAPQLSVSGTQVSWSDPTGFARCFLVVADGVPTITTATSATGSVVTVRCISAYGVTGEVASSDNPTGITPLVTTAKLTTRQYFTADGRLHSRLQHGLNIIRERYADGTTRTLTIIAK